MTAECRPFLVGTGVYLRPLVESDVEGPYVTWFNDEEVCRGNSHHVFPYTRAEALEFIQQAARTRDELVLAIILREEDVHIGNIALQRIHRIYRSADLAIVIGEKTAWGKGYGKEAGRLLCDHGFGAINLHRIGCSTFSDNTGMRELAVALGMKEEGVRRQAAFKHGGYVDVIDYGVLREEYERVRFGRESEHDK